MKYEKWLKDKEESSKTAIMMDAMTRLEVWDSGGTSITPGVYPVADVYPGHDEVVLAQIRLYVGLDGWYSSQIVFSYKDVQRLVGLGFADYS